jgi:hypothetical protein
MRINVYMTERGQHVLVTIYFKQQIPHYVDTHKFGDDITEQTETHPLWAQTKIGIKAASVFPSEVTCYMLPDFRFSQRCFHPYHTGILRYTLRE